MLKANHLLRPTANPVKWFVRHVYPGNFGYLLNNLPKFQMTELDNGLKVATEERDVTNCCIGIFVDAGARYESNFENGVTHFFEHICFKGTNARTRSVLEQQMTGTGALFECTTTRDMAGYRVSCLSSQAALCFDLLSDCVFNNSYFEPDIVHERGIVAAEMQDHDRDPARVLEDYLHTAAFQGCPLEQTIMGPSSNLCNFNSMTISRYMNKFFDSRRTAVVAVGGIKHDCMVSLAHTYMSKLEPNKCLDMDVYRFTGADVRYRDDSMPLALCALAVEAPCLCAEDRVALDVAKELIGGWDSSQPGGRAHSWEMARYAQGHGLAQAYKGFYYKYKDTGLFGVRFMSGRWELGDMMICAQRVLMGLVHLVTEREVSRAKHLLKAKLLSRNMELARMCAEAGRSLLYDGKRRSLAERVAAVDAVRAEDVRAVCDRYMDDRCPVVSAVGPVETLDDYSRICTGMYWLRA